MERPETIDGAHDGPPPADSGFFGEDTPPEDATFHIFTAPFEATVSYRRGAAAGPEAIRLASHQVDFLDPWVGDLRRHGWCWEAAAADVRERSDEARVAAERVIAALTRGGEGRPEDLRVVEDAYLAFAKPCQAKVTAALDRGKKPIVVGGDHSVALPGLLAALEHDPGIGILHVDAHADLRLAYEGFKYSHASVLRNAVEAYPDAHLMQVGIRDFCAEEADVMAAHPNLRVVLDPAWSRARLEGGLPTLIRELIGWLPQKVWLTVDIDGLDPTLCPSTGTPVPGGLLWDEMSYLLAVLGQERTVVGADLVEVSPGHPAPDDDTWDAIVGARLLYRMMGACVGARYGEQSPASGADRASG